MLLLRSNKVGDDKKMKPKMKPPIRVMYRSCDQFDKDMSHIIDGLRQAGYEASSAPYPAMTDPRLITESLELIDFSKRELFITDFTVGRLLEPLIKDEPSRIVGATDDTKLCYHELGPLDRAYQSAVHGVLEESGIGLPDDTTALGPFKEGLSLLVRRMIDDSGIPSDVFIDKRKITHHSPFYDIGLSEGYTDCDLRVPISPEPMQTMACDAIREGLIAGGIPAEIIAEGKYVQSREDMTKQTIDTWVIRDRHLRLLKERTEAHLELPLSDFYSTAIKHNLLIANPDAVRERVIAKLLEKIEESE